MGTISPKSSLNVDDFRNETLGTWDFSIWRAPQYGGNLSRWLAGEDWDVHLAHGQSLAEKPGPSCSLARLSSWLSLWTSIDSKYMQVHVPWESDVFDFLVFLHCPMIFPSFPFLSPHDFRESTRCPDPEECPIYSVFDWHKGDLFKGCGWIKALLGTL